MKILGLIPARGGSKGVPGKNIKALAGKPLLTYTAEAALASAMLSETILSSDDEAIISVALAAGIKVPFKRPDALAQDDTPTIDVMLHALHWYAQTGVQFDAVCLLQVTSPFRTAGFIDAAIAKFIESGCDSLVSVQRVPHEYNPHWTFEVGPGGSLQIATGEKHIITRRQDLPVAYHRDGVVYITKSDVVLKQHSIYGNSISFIESAPEMYVNIDTAADWKKAEEIAKELS